MIRQVSCSLLKQTWGIIFLLEKNHCQLSEFESSKKWYIRLPTIPRHKHFSLEGNRHQFAPFCSSAKMMRQVFSHLRTPTWCIMFLLDTPTWCIIFLLEKNRCQCSQFISSKKRYIRSPVTPWCKPVASLQQTKPVASSKQCIHQETTDYLQYHIFTLIELRGLAAILF